MYRRMVLRNDPAAKFRTAQNHTRVDLDRMVFHHRVMRSRLLPKLALALTLVCGPGPAWSADFVLGLQAFDLGNYEKAFSEWLPLALDGNPDAQFNIGFMYQNGLGVDANPLEAATWYLRAGRAGIADAQYNLGLLYSTGQIGGRSEDPLRRQPDALLDVPGEADRNLGEAARWFLQAAVRGHVEARLNIGMMLSVGAGIEPDLIAAYQWTGLAVGQLDEGETREFALDNLKRFETLMTEQQIAEARLRIENYDPAEAALALSAEDLPTAIGAGTAPE